MANSKIVFGCLRHRSVNKTIEPKDNKIVWVDCCKRDSTLRIHITGLEEDLLNRRGASTLTEILPLCSQDGTSAETGQTTEEDRKIGRKRSTMYSRAQSIDESSERKYQKSDVFIPGRRQSRIVVRGGGGAPDDAITSTRTKKVEYPVEFLPGQRHGGGRSSRKPGRLICET